MKTFVTFLTLSFCVTLVPQGGLSAAEFNKRTHLDPGSQAKVNKVIAASRQENPFGTDTSGKTSGTGCGDLKVGNLNNSGRPPREVIIVARDIINVNRGC